MFKRSCLFVIAAVLVFTGCKKADEYPIVPAITFKLLTTVRDAQGFDTEAIIEFEFTDGDGDIGLNDYDTLSPYVGEYLNNIHAVYYQFINGVWTPLSQFDDRGRLPVITPEGNQKAIRGEIRKDKLGFPLAISNQRIRYEVYIYDRALHKSNVIITSEITVTTH